MEASARFDVLVIGSGASGLAAAVAAERAGARVGLATKGSIQANNSSKAQGGIQAAFAADDSPELHAEDVMRSSHETADPRLVEILTGDAQSAIHRLEELGCAFPLALIQLPVAPDLIRGWAALCAAARRKALARVKHGPTEMFGHRVARDGSGEFGAFPKPKNFKS